MSGKNGFSNVKAHSGLSRRTVLRLLSSLVGIQGTFKSSAKHLGPDNWPHIESAARKFVTSETGPTQWPFELPDPDALARSHRKVWIHYFTPLPLSLDNKDPRNDYFHNAIRRDGEGGKFVAEGGYLRDRPITPLPWPAADWRLYDACVDLLRAGKIGADGFMLDVDWVKGNGQLHDIIEALCAAADRVIPRIRIIAQPDMASLSTETPTDIADFIITLADKHPSLYRLPDGRLVVAPFAPDYRSPAFWSSFKSYMQSRGKPIAFIPVMLNLGQTDSLITLAYGLSAWGSRVPEEALAIAEQISTLARNLKTWIMPIAPQDSRPNSSIFWEARNTSLFRDLWSAAIDYGAPEIHLITWNDFSETTAIEPSVDTQFVFYDLAAFFIATYKLGRAPEIVRDAIYYTHRRQIVRDGNPAVSDDRPMHRMGTEAISNEIELLAFLVSPATIEIRIANQSYRLDAEKGLVELRAPAAVGRPEFSIYRGHTIVVHVKSAWEILAHPDRDDFTYYGGSSLRVCQSEQCQN